MLGEVLTKHSAFSVSPIRLTKENHTYMKSLVAVLIILLGLLQYKLWFDNNNLFDVWHLKQILNQEREKNKLLMERNKALLAEVHDLKQGYEAIEEHARTDLGMIKDDEVFYQIVDRHKKIKDE
ncbi:MAG: hypothetical protein Tsb005_02020 [Gammaproteobacteria bacterium]